MSARDEILAAIRRAAVPSSPAAREVPHAANPGPLRDQFIAVLERVGGHAISRGPEQSLHDIAASLVVETGAAATIVRGRASLSPRTPRSTWTRPISAIALMWCVASTW